MSRKTVGDNAILSVGEELRLGSPSLECDVLTFEDALDAGDRTRATTLYTGALMDGFFLATHSNETWPTTSRSA